MSEANDGDRRQAFLADRQADAWQEFLMTGRPSALADYLRYEGDVDEHVRAALIAVLRGQEPLLNKGGRDPWRDYRAFLKVGTIERSERVSKTEACRRYLPRQSID